MIRRRKLGYSALFTAALLSGCALGPDYERPEVPLPERYGAEQDAGAEAPSISATWWTAFDDPVLVELVDKALANNADLAQAAARVEQADALLRQAGAALFPELGLDGSATRSRSSQASGTLPPGAQAVRSNFQVAATTAFELDFWGRLRRAREAARAQALASRYGRDTVQLTLTSAVAQSYLTLRALDAQVAVARETLASRERTQELIQRRADAGVASPLEVQQAEVSRASAAAQLAERIRQRGLITHQLQVLTGELGLTVPADDLRKLPLPPTPPPGLPSALLDARPDVRQAEALLASSNALIGVAKAALFPSISLTGSFGGASAELSDLFDSNARIWSVGAVLDLPLFDAGRRRARVDEVSAQQREALAGYIQAVRGAFQEVNDALVNVRQAAEAEEALASQLKAARRALELSEIRYKAGYSGFLEVLDAQRNANQAEQAFIDNRQQRLIASVSLFKALGGGWTGQ